jgi:Neuraminidase-like domain/Putative peptidoglycan binding domain/Salmonella virulence plasmid 28.1kDa A protein
MELQGRDLSQDMQGEDVKVLQAELAQLGLKVADNEAAEAVFASSTMDAVRRFQKQHGLPTTGVVEAITAREINAAVDALAERPDYSVSGTVFSTDRVGLAGLTVLVVDRNVGGDLQLAETSTDAGGRYQAGFAAAALQRAKHPDLQARAFADGQLLGASEVRYNAGTSEVLDVELPPDAALPSSEHEVLTGILQPLLPGVLRDLREDDGQQDITYLANKTGWDARAVAMASLADQFSQDRTDSGEGIDPAFYYALFRAGLPANPDTVYQTHVETVQDVWTQAADSGVIAASLRSAIPAAAQSFQALSARHALDVRPAAGTSTLRELLTPALGADDKRQQQFAQLYAKADGDLDGFWASVSGAFDNEISTRLQLDGKLAYLTSNNAALIDKLHSAEADQPLTGTADLASRGYFRAEKWQPLVQADANAIPEQVPGADAEEKRANYAEMLAAQVRLSYPTAVIAERVRAGELPIDDAEEVHQFLTANSSFELGVHPVELYLARNDVQLSEPAKAQVKLLQRVYTISPSDQAMKGLIQNGLHSAYAVSRYDRQSFVRAHGDALGGAEQARLVYLKAMQVSNSILNVATSYLTTRNAPPMGRAGNPVFNVPTAATGATGVLAYPTLEKLFGSMDYCGCDDCRSVLSPAAYLVDLLLFTADPSLPAGTQPQDVLLSRRPDIAHLPLTCENTNIALPYIDLVNETLEYFTANKLSLTDYDGHNTDGSISSAELLANPEFVLDAAYSTLSQAKFPSPLPFSRPLETLRRLFGAFGQPLAEAMSTLRAGDAIERADDASYGWRDILMEQLRISREEYRLLTDSSISLAELAGFPAGTTDDAVTASLANLQNLTRRLDISPQQLLELLSTRFVNPGSTLLPRLQRLALSATSIRDFHSGTLNSDQLRAMLPVKVRGADYGATGAERDAAAYPTIEAWLGNQANFDQIMNLLTIVNPTNPDQFCSLDQLELRHLNPDDATNRLSAFDLRRLLRFVRLWKKLGLSLGLTDRVITALYPAAQQPTGSGDQADLDRLDACFAVLLPRAGIVLQVAEKLRLRLDRDLISLLACWSDIDVHGEDSLYRKLFLSAPPATRDAAFADDGAGNFLKVGGEKLLPHSASLRAALTLTEDEFAEFTRALHFDASTDLSLANVSALYRHGWLARRLRLSPIEFNRLVSLSGLDPFTLPDPANPPISRFLQLVDGLAEAGIKPVQALYLIWNQDLSGRSAPPDTAITDFARVLRAGFAAVDNDFRVVDDPNGDITRSRLGLVYPADVVDFYLGLLNNTLATQASYSQLTASLPPDVLNASIGESGKPRLAYDSFGKLLTYSGVLTAATRDTLKAGQPADLQAALDSLYDAGQLAIAPFFDRFPGLRSPYESYATDPRPAVEKRSALLQSLLPQLVGRRKVQQALSAMTAATRTEPALAEAVLADASVLTSAAGTGRPAVEDLVAMQEAGLSATFFFRNSATGTADLSRLEPGLSYGAGTGSAHLPSNPAGGTISGVWSGYLAAPQTDAFNLLITVDPGATVGLRLGEREIALDHNGAQFSNHDALELVGGTLYPLTLTVENVTDSLSVQWQTTVLARQPIPAVQLYPQARVQRLRRLFITFNKAATLAELLHLSSAETVFLAGRPELSVAGGPWLAALTADGDPDPVLVPALRDLLLRLLDYVHAKSVLTVADDRLLTVLKDPTAGIGTGTSALTTLTGWDDASLTALLTRFGRTRADLEQLATFRRVLDAFTVVKALTVPADTLLAAATNQPSPAALAALQAALRARYDPSSWLDVIKPVNDELRSLQRDALVAYILQQFSLTEATAYIDTPDKLFEFFLMDVEMAACTQTSRIRHALSAVQLFIDRCLLNLEADISPDSLNASRWEWMKRYRVWEANRKVFLWPENWLEPELRDHPSPFFTEAMSELLQKDITEDTAAEALLNYLSKLQEVAKLEPCGIYYQENSPGLADDVLHLIARTTGAHRKYFYRRRDPSGWTPWEQVKLDIEDNPVSPVIWQGRLFLFWLRLIKQNPQDAGSLPSGGAGDHTKLTEVDLAALKSGARSDAGATAAITVSAVLNWSEYYNGRWQPPKTSDPADTMTLTTGNVAYFDRSQITLRFTETPQPLSDARALRVIVEYGDFSNFFLLHNTHSLPLVGVSRDLPPGPGGGVIIATLPSGYRMISNRRGTLTLDYFSLYVFGFATMQRSVLLDPVPFDIIEPRHRLDDPWQAPFLLHDSRHVFYVSSGHQLISIRHFNGFAGAIHSPKASAQIAGILQKDRQLHVSVRRDPVLPQPQPDGRAPVERFVRGDLNINLAFGESAAVLFKGRDIGAIGGLVNGNLSGRQ